MELLNWQFITYWIKQNPPSPHYETPKGIWHSLSLLKNITTWYIKQSPLHSSHWDTNCPIPLDASKCQVVPLPLGMLRLLHFQSTLYLIETQPSLVEWRNAGSYNCLPSSTHGGEIWIEIERHWTRTCCWWFLRILFNDAAFNLYNTAGGSSKRRGVFRGERETIAWLDAEKTTVVVQWWVLFKMQWRWRMAMEWIRSWWW